MQRRAPAVVLLLLFLIPIVQPVTTAEVATDDFGILDALDELLEDRSVSSSDLIAEEMASSTLSSVNAAARDVREGDAIVEAERFLDGLEVRDSTPLNRTTHAPTNSCWMLKTTAGRPSGQLVPDLVFRGELGNHRPLAIGINTYAIYLNFSTRTTARPTKHGLQGPSPATSRSVRTSTSSTITSTLTEMEPMTSSWN